MVVGYPNEAAATGADGGFSLSAHAASGQIVSVHVQKDGYTAANEDCPAGDTPATIVIRKK
jgi:hypothetical protein